jgi:hypothetical protein
MQGVELVSKVGRRRAQEKFNVVVGLCEMGGCGGRPPLLLHPRLA